MYGDEELEAELERLDDLLSRVEDMPDAAGEVAREAVAALARVYGDALARVMAACSGTPDVTGRLVQDPLLDHLLALHGIHPKPLQERLDRAIQEMQIRLRDDGALQLEGVEEGIARVRVPGGGCGRPDVAPAVRDILLAAAPELADVRTTPAAPAAAFIPVSALRKRPER